MTKQATQREKFRKRLGALRFALTGCDMVSQQIEQVLEYRVANAISSIRDLPMDGMTPQIGAQVDRNTAVLAEELVS